MLHPFSTNAPRDKVIAGLALFGALVAYLFSEFQLATYELPWWIDVPSPLAIFGALYAFVNIWAWRWFPLAAFLRIPNVNGTWLGCVRSPHPAVGEDLPAVLRIRQRFGSVQITFETLKSRSYSTMASINEGSGLETGGLQYKYWCRPKSDAHDLVEHWGMARLDPQFSGNQLELEGEYFTGLAGGRQHVGRLWFALVHRDASFTSEETEQATRRRVT